jgi:hypothetical protein
MKFGLDSTQYEIDLSEANAKKLLGTLDPWMKAARKTGGRKGRRGGGTNGKGEVKAVREWAKKQGLNKPLIGETTLLGQKVIDLAGDAQPAVSLEPSERRPDAPAREAVRGAGVVARQLQGLLRAPQALGGTRPLLLLAAVSVIRRSLVAPPARRVLCGARCRGRGW